MVGWNPDYQDPSNLIFDTLQITFEDQTKVYLGFAGVDNPSAKAVGLDESKLLTMQTTKHKNVMKNMQYSSLLTDSAIRKPTMSSL